MKRTIWKRMVAMVLAAVMLMIPIACHENKPQKQVPTELTVNFHYLRTDGKYDGWNVWMWTDGEGLAYQFDQAADENGVALTAKFPVGTPEIGFIVRLNEWESKDIDQDQFILTKKVYGGTVDVFVKAGKTGYTMELGEDCMTPEEANAANSSNQNQGQETQSTQPTYEYVEYVYDQELNIIDDNYRNYYEIFVRSFYDSDGDGLGDLKGVTEKLDYVKELGFNGIWFMPLMQSSTYHKYDVIDYCSIDSEYGTMEDFDEMVGAAHARGIRVIIDLVMNHSSTKNEWFVKASKYLAGLSDDEEPDLAECPYVDYYHFSRVKETSGYQAVPGTGNKWYYECVFDSGMPDLNLSSVAVRKEFEDISDFWMEHGVDGFRMDAALHYEENDHAYNIEVLNWIYSYCRSKNPDFYMVSEVWDGPSVINRYYESESPSFFNFGVSGAEGVLIMAGRGKSKAGEFVSKMVSIQNDLAQYSTAIDAPFITNHDQARAANAVVSNGEYLKMTAGLLLTMNGSPFVYYGEEIGMKSKGTSDPNKRLPMVWSKNDTTGITVLPSGADKGIESSFPGVDEQLKDPTSLLNYYKRANQLRNENPEIARGTVEKLSGFTGYTAGVTKTWEGSTIGIIYNNGEEAVTIDLSETELKGMQIRGYLTVDGSAVTMDQTKLQMPKMSIVILK